MNRRLSGRVCLATALLMVLALTACTQPDTGTTIKMGSFAAPLSYFAPSAAGAFVIDGNQAFTVAKPGAKAQAALCCTAAGLTSTNQSSHQLDGGSVALDGTPWVILDDNSIIDLKGNGHVAAPAVRRLENSFDLKVAAAGGKPATTSGVDRNLQSRAVSVVDSREVLAATWSVYGPDSPMALRSMVFRVSATGTPVAVAGRPGPGTTRSLSGLKIGERVRATDVDLKLVEALVVLDRDSFVLFMASATKGAYPEGGRLQAAVVTNGLISRLTLPVLCADAFNVVTSRISDHEVVLSAVDGTANCRGPDNVWLRIDTAKNTFTRVGSGHGYAGIDGNQLLTATTLKQDSRSSTTVGWQDLTGTP